MAKMATFKRRPCLNRTSRPRSAGSHEHCQARIGRRKRQPPAPPAFATKTVAPRNSSFSNRGGRSLRILRILTASAPSQPQSLVGLNQIEAAVGIGRPGGGAERYWGGGDQNPHPTLSLGTGRGIRGVVAGAWGFVGRGEENLHRTRSRPRGGAGRYGRTRRGAYSPRSTRCGVTPASKRVFPADFVAVHVPEAPPAVVNVPLPTLSPTIVPWSLKK